MAKLSGIPIQKRTVPVSGGSFDVQGLSTSDLVVLYRTHKDEIVFLFETLRSYSDSTDMSLAQDVLEKLSVDAIAMIIALGAGEPEALAYAKQLTVGQQLDALEKIGLLTFTGEDALKKSVETLARMMAVVQESLVQLRTSNPSFTG